MGAAEAEREATELSMDALHAQDYNRWGAAARAQLDDATFAAAWAEGRALTLEQAIAEALGHRPSWCIQDRQGIIDIGAQ